MLQVRGIVNKPTCENAETFSAAVRAQENLKLKSEIEILHVGSNLPVPMDRAGLH